jgi:hypothetical protein
MRRDELEEQLKLLTKAVAEQQPSANVIPILKRLQAEVVPTEEILRVSAISYVRRRRSSCNPYSATDSIILSGHVPPGSFVRGAASNHVVHVTMERSAQRPEAASDTC